MILPIVLIILGVTLFFLILISYIEVSRHQEAIERKLKMINGYNDKYGYEVIRYQVAVGVYLHKTIFYDMHDSFKVVYKKWFLFGREISYLSYPIEFVLPENIESPDLTKEKLKTMIDDAIAKVNRGEEIKRGKLI